MKTLILFFPSQDIAQSAFDLLSEKMTLRKNQMLDEIPQEKVHIYMVRHKNNFFWKNEFLPQFKLIWNTWNKYPWKKHVFWDLIYWFNMWEWVSNTYPSKIKEITKNKQLIEDIFPSVTLKSIIAYDYKDIQIAFNKIISNIKVIKPCSWTMWNHIHIWENIPEKNDIHTNWYPYIIQEFHDTSWGFYNLCTWLHDFRVVILWGKIIAKTLREPKKNSYISNTHQWWTLYNLADFSIPKEIKSIIEIIDNYCKKFDHRYYSIDMWVGKNGKVRVFELNGAPWFWSEYAAREFWKYTAKNILKVI